MNQQAGPTRAVVSAAAASLKETTALLCVSTILVMPRQWPDRIDFAAVLTLLGALGLTIGVWRCIMLWRRLKRLNQED